MIKAVLIDIDNTLLDFNECARYAIRSSFDEKGIKYPSNVFDVFFEINTLLWNDIENGIITKTQLYAVRWNKIFERLNMDVDGVDFENYFLKYLGQSYRTVRGAEDILRYLSEKYILCAASNGPHEEQLKRLGNANLLRYFDHIFTSEAIGYPKPQKEFFDKCIANIGSVSPDEIMIIGDSLSADIEGAKKCGLRTCWFNFSHQPVTSPPYADATVDALEQIKEVL